MTPDAAPAKLAAIILAAGAGTRMKSELPKPLHQVAGRSMLVHVLNAVEALHPDEVVIVGSPDLLQRPETGDLTSRARVVVQDPPRGTGDAVLTALRAMQTASAALVVYADHPLVSTDDLQRLLSAWEAGRSRVGLLTCTVDDAAGYGRVERDDQGTPVAIIEKVADDPLKRSGRTEINSGILILDADWATETLENLPLNPVKQELFLTDLVASAHIDNESTPAVVAIEGSLETLLGVNDRAELAIVDGVMRSRINQTMMRSGVTIIGEGTVFIDAGVTIGADSTIFPNTVLRGETSIGAGATIGPNTTIESSTIGDRTIVEGSVVRASQVGRDCHVGPWSHLRGGVVVDDNVHIGNFVEIKNSLIRTGVRAGHVSYLGDATIGENTNIGAGAITCNFDGVDKHRTIIGSNVFIGSDSMLVAPLTIGDGAATGAGSVVTKDVAPGAKVVGVPARPIRARRSE